MRCAVLIKKVLKCSNVLACTPPYKLLECSNTSRANSPPLFLLLTVTANSPPLFLLLHGLFIQTNVFSCMDKHCEPCLGLYGPCALTQCCGGLKDAMKPTSDVLRV